MSRLTELVRRVEQENPALGQELGQEIKALLARRSFGLNFERHMPESVELPERTVRRGDKVRFRAPRGVPETDVDQRVWRVTRIEGRGEARTAHLTKYQSAGEPERATRRTADLVVIAEFRDPIYPGLRSTGTVERGGDKPYHAVINGENYHALEALLFAYEGKVDCIYIDPPYNTRDRDWKYNNDYVDSDDAYRHSKWLAMMERRLLLARRLLNPQNSVLIVTIDEKEYLRLGLLLDQVFAGCNIQMVTSVIAPAGQPRGNQMSRVEEYLFCVYVGSIAVQAWSDDMLSDKVAKLPDDSNEAVPWENLIRRGTSARRVDRQNQFFPIFIDPDKKRIVSVGDPLLPVTAERAQVEAPKGAIPVWPIRSDGSEGRWRVSKAGVERLLQRGLVRVGRMNAERGQWAINYILSSDVERLNSGAIVSDGFAEDGSAILRRVHANNEASRRTFPPKTVWNRDAHNAGNHGSALLRRFLPGRVFPFPKSLYAVEDSLRFFVQSRPEAIILDFFAGSGTTAHAVMRLNKQDGGQRRSIMVTNNEVSAEEEAMLRRQGLRLGDPQWNALGISEYITKPRIAAAVTGLTPEGEPIRGDYRFTDEFPMAEGFEENVEFFDLTYEDPERIRHDLAFSAIAPLLWMRARSEGARIETPNDTFALAATYGVLFNLDAAAGFVQAMTDVEHVRVAYIVTDDEKQYQIIADALPDRVETVRLYEAYLRTFQVGGGED